jgi:hypothetical protein
MGETNSPSVAHVGYDISPLSRVKYHNSQKNNLNRRLMAKLNNLTREFVEINILSPKNLPSPPH